MLMCRTLAVVIFSDDGLEPPRDVRVMFADVKGGTEDGSSLAGISQFSWFRRRIHSFFLRLTSRLPQGQPDPDQSKKFMFMCLSLFLVTNNYSTELGLF